jgi:hypothetical protein
MKRIVVDISELLEGPYQFEVSSRLSIIDLRCMNERHLDVSSFEDRYSVRTPGSRAVVVEPYIRNGIQLGFQLGGRSIR